MNLLNDFFKIMDVSKADQKFTIGVELNPAHEIFQGHFPGNPVVPGVCMVQMLKEILKHIFNKEFTMKEASQLKFLALLNPNEVKALVVEFSVLKDDNDGMVVSGTFQKAELVFLKFKGTFIAN